MLNYIFGACGIGKTKTIAELAVGSNSFLYVAPTRALAAQFANMTGAQLVFGRCEKSCSDRLVFILPSLRIPQSQYSYCLKCALWDTCSYMQGLRKIITGKGKIATTLAFIQWQNVDGLYDIIAYDDIPLPIITATGAAAKLALRRVTAPYISKGRGRERFVFGFPKLPRGRTETYLVGATQYPTILSVIFGDDEPNIVVHSEFPLQQDVLFHLRHLTMSSRWYPPPGSCGLKKNTPQGLPYIGASEGLGNWRGVQLSCCGSFLMPLVDFYAPLLALLEEAYNKPFRLEFVPGFYSFHMGDKIYSGFWAVKKGEETVQDLTLAASYYIVQLLGRSGINVTNEYYGDAILGGMVGGLSVKLARRIILASAPPMVVQFHTMRWLVANALQHGITRGLTKKDLRYKDFVLKVLQAVEGMKNVFREHIRKSNDSAKI